MKRSISAAAGAALAVVGVTMALAGGASAGNGTGITATPPATKTFNGSYSATFNRSASGLINETNRVNSAGAQNGWTSADVWLQFRPLTNPSGGVVPNPTCDPAGLVTAPFTYTNDQPNIAGTATSGYFLPGVAYNVCVYYVPNQVVASGSIDSSAFAGTTTAALPTSGHYRIDVSGTYANNTLNVADAEYTSVDNWATQMDGYNIDPYFLGEGFGDVQVNGGFVNWGAYNVNHTYSLTTALTGTSVNLAVFDGDSNTNIKNPAWYGDNSGSLNYTITYVGP